jgi:hypothetical protein
MDIGTSGFTEFKDTEDIIAYRLDHKEKLLKNGVYEGLIHSHNNMSAFFSVTDADTLLSEGNDMNHFLSLIVCNNGPYVARITRKLKQRIKAEAHIVYTKTSEYDTFENQTIVLGTPEVSEADKTEERLEHVVEYFEGNIDKDEVFSLFDELDNRIDEIKRSKSKTTKSGTYYFNGDDWDYPMHNNKSVMFTKEPSKPEKKANEKQLSIFRDIEDDSSEPIELYKIEEVPLSITKTLCTQLMFGSILADGSANINLRDFTKRMDKVYLKRFGDLKDPTNSIRLENWISSMVEALITYTVDEDYENELVNKYGGLQNNGLIDDDLVAQLFADAMIQYMMKLPESDVKDMMIVELLKYMPNDYK